MAKSDHFYNRKREDWAAFFREMRANSDPQVARLMDDFRKVAHMLYQLGESGLESTGLSYAQFHVLMGLRYSEWAGNCEGLNPSQISAQQGTSRNTISALIRSLEDEGLIERHLDEEDRRRFNIHLTEAGRRKVLDHINKHFQQTSELFSVLDQEEIETLSGLLQTLSRHAQALKE